jgi:hypothetical protein
MRTRLVLLVVVVVDIVVAIVVVEISTPQKALNERKKVFS